MAHRDLLDEGRPVLAEVPPLEDLQHTHTHARQRAARDRRQSPPRPATQPAPCCWVAGPAGRFRKGARGREKPQ